ncbi:hypothetical protein [Rhodococcus sp. (in: high G+C Gram-positive bacteria)]|nr:hypothetical protein [Rhodococcus sp. (in: high G+C Gram-positive bacteria)]
MTETGCVSARSALSVNLMFDSGVGTNLSDGYAAAVSRIKVVGVMY